MGDIFQYTVTQPQIHAAYSKMQYSDLRSASMCFIPFSVGRYNEICKVLLPGTEVFVLSVVEMGTEALVQ
jgi:hypothetical protein